MKKGICLFTFLLPLSTAFAQSDFYRKKITPNANLYFQKIKNTNDNGFLVSGYTGDSLVNNFFLSKIDSSGNLNWAKKVNVQDFKSQLVDAIELNDGGILVAYAKVIPGWFSYFYGKPRLVKFDKTMSNVVWSLESTTDTIQQIKGIKQLKNGNIAVAATMNISAVETNSIVFILDSNGNLIWQKTYTCLNKNNLILELSSINELNDGQLLLIGKSYDITKNNKQVSKLCKIDANNGAILWQNDYESSAVSNDNLTLLNEDKEGNLYFKIQTYTYGAFINLYYGIAKMDKKGNVIWRKDYTQFNDAGDIAAKPDGSFMVIFTSLTFLNYQANINKDGKVTSCFKDIEKNLLVNAHYDKKGNLGIFRTFVTCNNNPPINNLVYEKRAGDGKGACSFIDSITVQDRLLTITNVYPLSAIANYPLNFNKNKTIIFPDLKIVAQDKIGKCTDTTFVTRCEGQSYTVNGNKFTKEGLYIYEVIPGTFPECIDAKVVKLTFLKKNNPIIDTTIGCGKSISFAGTTYNMAGTYQKKLKNKLGCDSIVTLKLDIRYPSSTNIDTTICEGKSYKIGTKEFAVAGDYKEVLKTPFGCDSIVSLQLKVKNFELNPLDTIAITVGEKANLIATSTTQQVTYEWSPPDNLTCVKCPETIATPSTSTDYTVKGTSKEGCEAETSVHIKVFPIGAVFIPTAFSPNGDGTNDFFTAFVSKDIEKIVAFSIFDRWGNHIFYQKDVLPNDPNIGWDGKYKNEKAQQGVYTYLLQIQMANGKIKKFSGDVLLQ